MLYYTLKDATGKKVWVKVGWRSEGYSAQYAADARAKAVQTIRDGAPLKRVASMTFAEAWDIFDTRWLATEIKQPEDERGRYRRYLSVTFGTRRLDAITLLELEELKAALLARPLSAASVRLILGDIRRVYRKMAEWGLYNGPDPTARLTMPKADNARTRYLTPQEAQRLLTELASRSATWHDITLTSLHTGMRLSEVLGIEVQDIDFAGGTIRIRDGKTGSRYAHMTEPVSQILQARCSSRPDSRIFTGKDGRHLIDSDTSNTFLRAVNACGLNPKGTDHRNRVSFHTLRHTYCSWLAMRGVPLYVIGELVGHTTTQMTKRYAHLCPSTAKSASRCIETVLNQWCEHDAPPDNPPQPDGDTAHGFPA